jgi:hypothetical protein
MTKDSSLLLHDINSLSTGVEDFKRRLFSGLKNPYKNINETSKLESVREQHLAEMKDDGRKTVKNFSFRRLEFKPRNLE